MQKSWQLNRRTMLKGSGVSLGLPLMNGMLYGNESKALKNLPRRSAFIFFPHGINQHKKNDPNYKDWHWWPEVKGNSFQLRENHKYLRPFKKDISFVYGLRNTDGTGDPHVIPSGFLTGTKITGQTRNTISIDQKIALKLGLSSLTPIESMVLSSDGGTGSLRRSLTLSYDQMGASIPALNNLKYIYGMLFGIRRKEDIKHKKNLLDRTLESAKDLNRSLGKEDQQRLAEYMDSIRSVEKKIENDIYWADVLNKQNKNKPKMELNLTYKDVERYIQTMYELIYLAFKSDLTRLATYQISSEGGGTGGMPVHAGLSKKNIHAMSHERNFHGKQWGSWDQFLSKQLAFFINKLKSTPEADGNLLDRTMITYGSATGWTHVNKDYPIILAGGRKMGHKSGQFVKCPEENWQLANLFMHIARSMGVQNMKSFANSTDYELSKLFV